MVNSEKETNNLYVVNKLFYEEIQSVILLFSLTIIIPYMINMTV